MSTLMPKITNYTNDYSQLGMVPSDDLKIAMPIEGETGRMTTMKISSQAQLLKEYANTSEISLQLNDSILHALKLLQFTSIYTSRVGSTNVLPGRADKPDMAGNFTVFTDSEFDPYYKSYKFDLGSGGINKLELKTEVTKTASDNYVDLIYKSVGADNIVSLKTVGNNVEFAVPKSDSNKISKFNVNGESLFDEYYDNGKYKFINETVIDKDNIFNLSANESKTSITTKEMKDLVVNIGGLSFISAIPSNAQLSGVKAELKFYAGHGETANSIKYIESTENISNLNPRMYLVYINDYLNSRNDVVTPFYLDGKVHIENIPANVSIEVLGDELNKCIEFDSATHEVKLLRNDCKFSEGGFKVTVTGTGIPDEVYYIGVKLSDIPGVAPTASRYYELSLDEVCTTSKLVTRLYEVMLRSDTTGDTWMKLDPDGLTFNYPNSLKFYNPGSITTSDSDILYRKAEESDYYVYSVVNYDILINNVTYEDQWVKVSKTTSGGTTNYIFYNGSYSSATLPGDVLTQIKSNKLSYREFLSELISNLKTVFNASYSDNGFTLFTKNISESYEVSTSDKLFSSTTTASEYDYTSVINGASLIVVSTSVNTEDILKFELNINPNNSDLYNLVLRRKNDEESYSIAFKENTVDGYGVNRYYTYVNDEDNGSKYFRLVRINNDSKNLPNTHVESILFGAEVKLFTPSTTDWQVAVNRFREFTGDYYDFIFDAGHANNSLANTIYNLSKDLYAQALLTFPDEKSVDNLIIYRNNLGIDHREAVMRVPRVPDTTLGNFVVDMSPITQYLERIFLNKSAGKEFAPVFGITNGSASLAPKYRYDKEEDRQRLCDVQIAPLVWDRARQLPYFLLDITGQRQDSNMSDANNVRMDNIIAHLSKEIAQKYIGRFNDEATRSEYVSELNVAIQQRLISHQQYRINAYKIICDETNNPDEIIELRQLIVDIYEQYRPGIRWIKIYQGIYKLTQSI